MRIIGAVVLLTLLAGADAKDGADPKLEGTWVLTGGEVNGKVVDQMNGSKIIFAGKIMQFVLKVDPKEKAPKTEDSPFSVDTSKTPHTIDMKRKIGKKMEPELGIYEIKGDELTLCIGPIAIEGTFTKEGADTNERVRTPSKRPTEFASKGAVLLKLKREKK